MNRKTNRIIFVIILFLGGALRFIGIQYGLPGIYNSDESLHLLNVMYMGATRNVTPMFFLYPTAFHVFLIPVYGAYYILGHVFGVFRSPFDLAVSYAVHPTGLFVLGRAVSAIFGTMTIYLVWMITNRWFNSVKYNDQRERINTAGPGLWAASLMAFSYLHVDRSHWLLLEAPLAFACVLALLWILKASENSSSITLTFAGLFVGVAISVKYNAGFLILPFFVVVFWLRERQKWHKIFGRLGIGVLALLFGIFIGTPSLLWAHEKFLQVFHYQRSIMHTGWIGQSSDAGIFWPFLGLLKSDVTIAAIMLVSIFAAFFHITKEKLLVLLFIVPTLVYLCIFKTTFIRYLVPIVPAMAILAGQWLSKIFTKFSKPWLIAFIFLLLIWPLGKIVLEDIRLSLKDTRRTAEEWFERNVEPGTTIAYENYVYGPNLFDPDRLARNIPSGMERLGMELERVLAKEKQQRIWFRLVNFRESLVAPCFFDSLSASTKVELLEDAYLREVYSWHYKPLEELKTLGVKYIIISSDNYFRYFDDHEPLAGHPLRPYFDYVRGFYSSIIRQEKTRLVAEFSAGFWNCGPTIKIYSIE